MHLIASWQFSNRCSVVLPQRGREKMTNLYFMRRSRVVGGGAMVAHTAGGSARVPTVVRMANTRRPPARWSSRASARVRCRNDREIDGGCWPNMDGTNLACSHINPTFASGNAVLDGGTHRRRRGPRSRSGAIIKKLTDIL